MREVFRDFFRLLPTNLLRGSAVVKMNDRIIRCPCKRCFSGTVENFHLLWYSLYICNKNNCSTERSTLHMTKAGRSIYPIGDYDKPCVLQFCRRKLLNGQCIEKEIFKILQPIGLCTGSHFALWLLHCNPRVESSICRNRVLSYVNTFFNW